MGATLPELVERAKLHAGEKKIASSTVNKLLGRVQAVELWGFGAGSSSIVVHSGISLLGRGQSRLLTDVQSWSARPPIATLDPGRLLGLAAARHMKKFGWSFESKWSAQTS